MLINLGRAYDKIMKRLTPIFFILLLIGACQGSGVKQSKSIIVYGSNNCDHCVEFKAKLDSVMFEYEFIDVEFNESMQNEMVQKVRNSGVSGGFKYPVIDVEGKILVAPELNELLELM
ncbi:MAG: hypothetical protein DHS20C17_29960 [Cyclobacteriaceae bacterium]|nr:MAG: hypothetical protein DHS20C17_29960 [Cyclobacteriaceae bacterium]